MRLVDEEDEKCAEAVDDLDERPSGSASTKTLCKLLVQGLMSNMSVQNLLSANDVNFAALRLRDQAKTVLEELSGVTDKISDDNTKGINGFKKECLASFDTA